MPSVRATPLLEFNRAQPLLSWAFPTLFRRGKAGYTLPCARTVNYPNHVRHLTKHRGGRFAHLSRPCDMGFNAMVPKRINTRSGFLLESILGLVIRAGQLLLTTYVLNFQRTSRSLERSSAGIMSLSGTLRGTHPFWVEKHRDFITCIKNLSLPHLFPTLSAVDLHWHD
jgi:hypothetical protein